MFVGRASEEAVFSVPANGIYYVGFNAYSSNGWTRALGIDDIRIVENGTLAVENVNKKEEVAVYPNPFVNNIYISNVEKVKSIVVNDFSGKQIKVLAPVKEVDLQELNTGVYMISLYYKDGSTKTFKVVKK
ncbi:MULTISPECIES: T9SS type A sorting domain-containing protein [Chryseobacterium]